MSTQTVELTEEQIHIIELVAHGWTDQRIAHELGISVSSVQRRLRAAAGVLGTESRVGIAVTALARGLIEFVDPGSR